MALLGIGETCFLPPVQALPSCQAYLESSEGDQKVYFILFFYFVGGGRVCVCV